MMQRSSIVFLVLFAAVALPSLAAPGRYAVTAQQVAAAVSNQAVQVSPDQVTLLSGVVANVAAPELRVKSIDRAGDQRAVARMECADSEQCLPFIVALHLGHGESVDPASPSSQRSAPVSQPRPAAFAVRAGSPATLLLDGPHVHINLNVICLENGAPGQIIHVTDRDRRQVYTAQVVQDGILEGRL
jgi:hypothetical protein